MHHIFSMEILVARSFCLSVLWSTNISSRYTNSVSSKTSAFKTDKNVVSLGNWDYISNIWVFCPPWDKKIYTLCGKSRKHNALNHLFETTYCWNNLWFHALTLNQHGYQILASKNTISKWRASRNVNVQWILAHNRSIIFILKPIFSKFEDCTIYWNGFHIRDRWRSFWQFRLVHRQVSDFRPTPKKIFNLKQQNHFRNLC